MTPVPDAGNTAATSLPASQTQQSQATVEQLPNAAIDLANRMFDLARSGDATLIHYLAAGLPPNLTNNRGDTLLMLASYHGHVNLVRRMLTKSQQPPAASDPHTRGWRGKPDPNQLNGRGQSIVAGAVFKGYQDVVRVLIEHGADPLAGQPNAEECAHMFNKWEGQNGFKDLFEQAPGRGVGGREAAPAVQDREEMRRVPRVGLERVATDAEQQTPQHPPPYVRAQR